MQNNTKEELVNGWTTNLKTFNQSMFNKIYKHLGDKKLSWRNMSNEELWDLLTDYYDDEKFIDCANILFFMWENKLRADKIKNNTKLNHQAALRYSKNVGP